jgi:hypothetical protein
MKARLLPLLVVLSAASGPDGARSTVAELRPQQRPSSYELIARALAEGRIDEETAYKYRVFAAFGHHGLPEPYQGDDGRIGEPPASVLAAGMLLETFSPATQAELRPFFLTPAMPGSWVELSADSADLDGFAAPDIETGAQPAGGDDRGRDAAERGPARRTIRWHTVLAAGGNVKVWAQLQHAGDSAKAEAIAREVTNTIWAELVPVLGRPKSDVSDPLNSGGPELDIFLVRPTLTRMEQLAQRPVKWEGLALPANPLECQDAAWFLLVDSRHPLGSPTSPGLLQTVAHEFAHAQTGAKRLQGGACSAYGWMIEATAVWAEHRAYPKAQSEQSWAPGFLADVGITLDASTAGAAAAGVDARPYESYLFPLHLQLNEGKEAAIGGIWNSFASNNLRYGIAAGLKAHGLEFEKVFPRFAVYNLNQGSVDAYRTLDQMNELPPITDDHDVSIPTGRVDYEKPINLSIEDLATHYVRFEFDQTVRMVEFENTLVPLGYAGVWALANIGGFWLKPEDLTEQHNRTWCRDRQLEDVTELILSFTNNEWRDPARIVEPVPSFEPVLRAYSYGCPEWLGSSTLVNTIVSDELAVTIVETINTSWHFAVDSAMIAPGKPPEYWKSVGGNITWRVQVTGACRGSASGNVVIPNLAADHVGGLQLWTEGGKRHHSGTQGPWPGDIPTYYVTCPNHPPALMALFGALGFFATDSDRDEVAPDGKSFGGRFTSQPAPTITVQHSYSFRCTRAKGC